MAGFLCETWEVVLAFWASSPARGHRSLTNVLAALTGSLGHWVATRPGSSLVLFRVCAHFHLFGSAPPSLYWAPGCALPSHLAPCIPRYRAGHLAGAQCLSKRTLSWSKPGCPYLNYFICNRRLLKVFWKLWTPFPWKMHRLTCLKCACISGCGSWRPIGGPKSWPLASHAWVVLWVPTVCLAHTECFISPQHHQGGGSIILPILWRRKLRLFWGKGG